MNKKIIAALVILSIPHQNFCSASQYPTFTAEECQVSLINISSEDGRVQAVLDGKIQEFNPAHVTLVCEPLGATTHLSTVIKIVAGELPPDGGKQAPEWKELYPKFRALFLHDDSLDSVRYTKAQIFKPWDSPHAYLVLYNSFPDDVQF